MSTNQGTSNPSSTTHDTLFAELESPLFDPLPSQPSIPGTGDILSPVSFELASTELNDLVSSFFATGETLETSAEKEEQKKSTTMDSKKAPSGSLLEMKQLPESFLFGKFTIGKLDDIPNFGSSSGGSGRALLQSVLHRRIDPISFSNPAARNQLVIVGTDTKKAAEQYFFCFDGRRVREGDRAIIGNVVIRTEPIQFSLWLSDSKFACARGPGRLETFCFSTTSAIQSTAVFSLHSDEIREVTVDPYNAHVIASTGYDSKLIITDLSKTPVQSINLSAVGGSVKWSEYSTSALGLTTDDGLFVLYDIRTGKIEQKYEAKKDLFTHLRYAPLNALLGLADGEIRHLDLRKLSTPLDSVEDPFCEGIGMLEFNYHKEAIVASGYSDFTVWKKEEKTNVMKIWSHSETTRTSGDSMMTYCAAFLDDVTIVGTTSEGYYGTWTQEFDLD